MPPKVKITKKNITDTALALVRRSGESVLNARSIAAELGCSTQPVFSNFANMEELRAAVVAAAFETYLGFISDEVAGGRFPKYKSFGMAYIRFAKEERELFKLLFMCDRSGMSLQPTEDFTQSIEMIMTANGVDRETAELMHLECWAFVHGIAAMLATSFLELDSELISQMVSDAYMGIRARHLSEVK